jgi:hypothetical protein
MAEEKESKPVHKISLGDVRDILIIAGIFLFFTGWVYIYYFYNYFGLSMSSVTINYADYLVYSYTVLTSYYWTPLLAFLVLIILARKWLIGFTPLAISSVLLFLALYLLAKKVASDRALEIRSFRENMRHISFVFKQDADFLAYKFNNDSLLSGDRILERDLNILKDTSVPSRLYLLGQNQEYFFVLYQDSARPGVKSLPFGNIYFINKSYVLYSKVILTSN